MLIFAAVAPTLSVQSMDGAVAHGSLVSIRDGIVALETEEGLREIPLSELQNIEFSADEKIPTNPATAWLRLVDGSRLATTFYETSGDDARIRFTNGRALDVPLRTVRAVRFGKHNAAQTAAWDRIRLEGDRTDRIAIRRQDKLDYLDGIIEKVNQQTVEFELDGEVIPVGIGKLAGILYGHRRGPEQRPAIMQLMAVDGSLLEVAEFSAGPEEIRVQTPCGISVQYRYNQIKKLDFSSEKIVYLSQLEPVSVAWTPYIELQGLGNLLERFYRPKKDRALSLRRARYDNGQLRIASGSGAAASIESYDRGISLHSRTRIAYDLPVGVRYFRARAGIDAANRQSGHVRLVIYGDREQLFATEVSGRDGPRDISVDLTGVRLLELFVDYGENQDVGDHLNLCNARLIK